MSGDYFAVERFMERSLCVQSMKEALTELTNYAGPRGVEVTLEDFDDIKSPCSRIDACHFHIIVPQRLIDPVVVSTEPSVLDINTAYAKVTARAQDLVE